MRIRRGAVALGTSIALIGSACGGGDGGLDVEQDPKAAVIEAFENMAEWDGTSMTLRVDSTVDTMLALDEGSGDMTEQLAQGILDSFVRIQGTSGDDAADSTDDEFSMLVNVEGIEAFEVRSTGGELYVRAAVRELLERYDTSGTALSDLESGLQEARSFGLDFVDTAIEGGWLKIEGYEQLASMMGGMGGAEQPDSEEAAAMTAELSALFQRFVEEDVTVTYVGSEDAGEHVRLAASGPDLLDLLEEFLEIAGSFASGVPGADPTTMIDELRAEAGGDLDDFTMPIEVWVDGDSIGRVGVDVVAVYEANQEMFEREGEPMPEGVERLAIHVDLEEFGGGVSAPDDATTVDLFSLFGQLMGQMGGEGAA